jgi:hypothetical protein
MLSQHCHLVLQDEVQNLQKAVFNARSAAFSQLSPLLKSSWFEVLQLAFEGNSNSDVVKLKSSEFHFLLACWLPHEMIQ